MLLSSSTLFSILSKLSIEKGSNFASATILTTITKSKRAKMSTINCLTECSSRSSTAFFGAFALPLLPKEKNQQPFLVGGSLWDTVNQRRGILVKRVTFFFTSCFILSVSFFFNWLWILSPCFCCQKPQRHFLAKLYSPNQWRNPCNKTKLQYKIISYTIKNKEREYVITLEEGDNKER